MMEIQRSRVRETLSLSRFGYRSLDPLGGMDEDADFSFNERIDMETALAGDSQILWDRDAAFEQPPECVASGAGSGSTPAAPAIAQSVGVVTFGGGSSSGMPPVVERPSDTPVPAGGACVSEPGAIGTIAHMNGDDELGSLAPGSAVADHIKKRRLLPGAASSDVDFLQMFHNYDTSATTDLRDVKANVVVQKASIVHRTKELLRMVTEAHPGWHSYLRQLAVGALSMYRLRLTDMFLREQVLLLWVIEGGDYIRAHGGSCYMYHDDGAFQTYKGIPPESTFGRVKEFLLRLEGLFCLLPKDTKRSDVELLQAIKSVLGAHLNFD